MRIVPFGSALVAAFLIIECCSPPQLFAGGNPAKLSVPLGPVGYIVGEGGSILRSTNAGKSWMTQAVSLPELTSVRFINNTTGFVTGKSDIVLLTIDGGTTWGRKSANSTRQYFDVTWFDSTNAVFVGGRKVLTGSGADEMRALIMVTNDVGNSWNSRGEGILGVIRGIVIASPTRAIAVGDSGIILITNDAGVNWERKNAGTRNQLNSIAIYDSLIAVAVGTNGTILRTTNGGKTWDEQSGTAAAHLHGVTFSSEHVGLAVGDGGLILRSLDKGKHWIEQTSGTDYNLLSVAYANDKVALTVGQHGTMVRTIDGGDTWDRMDNATSEDLMRVTFARFSN